MTRIGGQVGSAEGTRYGLRCLSGQVDGGACIVDHDSPNAGFSPVLRSLARLKPTMTLEEGLPRAVQEWEHTSNFDRMIFYEMAEK